MATPSSTTVERRAAVRRELAAGDVTGLRDLAARLQAADIAVTPDALRADVRSLGAIRVQHGEGSVLALPVGDAAPAGRTTDRLVAEVSSDPDWPIQVGVAAVVGVFLLVALLGWLISG
jgi:arginine repressor